MKLDLPMHFLKYRSGTSKSKQDGSPFIWCLATFLSDDADYYELQASSELVSSFRELKPFEYVNLTVEFYMRDRNLRARVVDVQPVK